MKNLLLIVTLLAATGVAGAGEKGAEKLNTKSKPAKQNHGRVFQSHSKIVGGFGRYQVHSLRIRGLDSPNVSAAVIYDPLTETYTVVGPATGAGLGSAILGAAGNVGSSAVFGLSLRPDRHNINNGSQSEGGEATSVSVSEGGDSSATSVSDADAVSKSTSSASSKNHNKVTQSQGQVQSTQNSNNNSNSNANNRKNGNGPKPKTPKTPKN